MSNLNLGMLKFFSTIYLKLKENNLNSIDKNIATLQRQIEEEMKLLKERKQYLTEILDDNISIKKSYHQIERLFENENKTISIKNQNYKLHAWENVFIKKISSTYIIITKNDEEIYAFDKNMCGFLEYVLGLNYSIITLSVDKNKIILQIRLK